MLLLAHTHVVFTDNLSAKYLAIDFYFIRDLFVDRSLDVRYTSSKNQVADALTKHFDVLIQFF